MVKLHTSDIRMTYEYIRVTYGRHASAYEWHTDDIRVHTSDIRMTYEYIRVTYGWHTSTYEWHTDDIRVHTSGIQMTYEYIRVIYGWHTITYEWPTNNIRIHTSDIQMACECHANDIRYFKPYKGFGAFVSRFENYCGKNIVLGGCKWFLATRLFRFPYFLLEYS